MAKPVPTLAQVHHVLATMPVATALERRDRALIAFAALTVARVGALASLRLGNVNAEEGFVDQDARNVDTKFGKSFLTWFMPVGGEALDIVHAWLEELRRDHLWGPADPLFPATRMGLNDAGSFAPLGLVREGDTRATSIELAQAQKPVLAESDVMLRLSTAGPLRIALTTHSNRLTVIYDAATGAAKGSFVSPAAVQTLEFAPDGNTIFVGTENGGGAIWNATGNSRKPLVTLEGAHENGITVAHFSPDGGWLVTGSSDATARVWSTADGHLISTLKGHQAGLTGVTFALDGLRVLTSAEDRSVKLWDAITGRHLMTMRGPTDSGEITGWFSADGKQAITLSDDTTLRRWNIATRPFDATLLKRQACGSDGGRISDRDRARTKFQGELAGLCADEPPQ